MASKRKMRKRIRVLEDRLDVTLAGQYVPRRPIVNVFVTGETLVEHNYFRILGLPADAAKDVQELLLRRKAQQEQEDSENSAEERASTRREPVITN